MRRSSVIPAILVTAGLLVSCSSTPTASPLQVQAQTKAKAKSALVTSYEDTNKVLGTFAQQTLGCQQMQCFRAAATTARDAMGAIINRQHAAFGSYDGEHYTVFVYETALSYLKGDFAELAETYDQPSFTNIIQNTVEPHSAQFRSSGAQLLTAFGEEAVSGSSVD